MALARIGNNTVVSVLSQVIEDLVRGESLQIYARDLFYTVDLLFIFFTDEFQVNSCS